MYLRVRRNNHSFQILVQRAWSTRPNLDLDDTNFNGYRGDSKFDEFSEFTKKTIQRYEQSNLNIESFKLCIKSPWGDLANDLIMRELIFDYEVGDIRGLPKHDVENLTICRIGLRPPALSCFALFHGLFWTLVRGLNDEHVYGLHDLEKVNVLLFDDDVAAWWHLPLKSLSNASICPKAAVMEQTCRNGVR
ncbi:hypothetical protein PHJA_002455300 [Phtheirospermum japonicum]|uniref:Uncharacterized protein n=1 Tax=Phtheirospermum japonicum TaxID=374723 RepID=A0A830D3S9_9LAMI|nr:hypothetical protein PHJA_002455300 [Phtheirospermum japonicum]